MKRLASLVLLLALGSQAGIAPAAPQKDVVVQDGITLRPMNKVWRYFTSEQALNQQSALQYTGLLQKASQQGALVPEQDPRLRRLRAIAARLIPFAPRWNAGAKDWKWQVNLLQSDEVNAFCMPGGRIAFYTGIIDKLKLTDDEIAAVMGHEIAHALREHGLEQNGKTTLTSVGAKLGGAALSAWLGIDPSLTNSVTNTAGQLLVLKFSRDDEREADLVGLDVASRAGFDPRAGIALWRKMAELNQRSPIELLSTHPLGDERIQQIDNHMNVLLPLYARTKGTTADKLPPYSGNVTVR
ncbi:M48 family metallopeptidase [Massilia terrae]|uniref:M48 family metallopeptidase n=1 Tax=Massilia terrae TaxID=1811224 RepID=A0ABT2D636_9BURK|nr:M48 family metallopeptidase [Massilia terrae]MCS0660830.1 M48 family metallopeptidase [Massilia terrae]